MTPICFENLGRLRIAKRTLLRLVELIIPMVVLSLFVLILAIANPLLIDGVSIHPPLDKSKAVQLSAAKLQTYTMSSQQERVVFTARFCSPVAYTS